MDLIQSLPESLTNFRCVPSLISRCGIPKSRSHGSFISLPMDYIRIKEGLMVPFYPNLFEFGQIFANGSIVTFNHSFWLWLQDCGSGFMITNVFITSCHNMDTKDLPWKEFISSDTSCLATTCSLKTSAAVAASCFGVGTTSRHFEK